MTTTNLDKLRAWDQEARAKGLLDVKFFRGRDNGASLDAVAAEVVRVLESTDYEVITDLDAFTGIDSAR